MRQFLVFLACLACAGAATVCAQDAAAEWKLRYRVAEQRAQGPDGTAEDLCALLDAAYRLDAADKGLVAARQALQRCGDAPAVRGRAGRAFLRAGLLDDAARLLAGDPLTAEPVAALVLSRLLHADGETAAALHVALSGLKSAPDDYELDYQVALLHARTQAHLEAALHYERAELHSAAQDGYPAERVHRRCAGRAMLHRALAGRRANQLLAAGAAPFQLPAALPLPTFQVRVGEGPPLTMLLDLSGGGALSLDDDAARMLGLQMVAQASVADLTGQVTPTQWAIAPAVTLGECRLGQVIVQVYDFSKDNLPDIDGILGAGLFVDHRLELNLQQSMLVVSSSSTSASSGRRVTLPTRFWAGDQPLIPLTVGDQRANALLDIGWPMTCFSSELLASQQPPEAIHRQQLGDNTSGLGLLNAEISAGVPFRIAGRVITPPTSVALPFISGEASSTLGVRLDVLLGWDLFKHIRSFALDYPARLVIIEWI